MIFVECNFLFVAADAIGLPHNERIKNVFCGVGKHQLELLAIVIPSGHCAIAIFVNDRKSMCIGVPSSFGKLPFNGLLTLPVAGKSGINDSVHLADTAFVEGRSSTMRTICCSFRPARS